MTKHYACSGVVSKWFQEQHNKWYCWGHQDYSSYSVEKTKQKDSIPISTPLIYWDLMNLDTYLDTFDLSRFNEPRYLSRSIALRDFWYSLQCILIGYLFMGLCKPNRNRRAHLKCQLSTYLNKAIEKENTNWNAS